jgi:putative transposase
MARLSRLAFAGELHHLCLRGHNGSSVFADDADRADFVAMLREAALAQAVAVHAYALLDDEVHLLATPTAASALSRLMQTLGRRYVAAFNRRHQRRGTLWDGRFRSSVLDGAANLLHAMHLIERLPVARGLAACAADWRWSSAAHHLGRWADALVTHHPLYWRLGNTPFERELAHASMLEVELPREVEQRLLTALVRGHVVGGADFLARLAPQTARSLIPRPRGRPRK